MRPPFPVFIMPNIATPLTGGADVPFYVIVLTWISLLGHGACHLVHEAVVLKVGVQLFSLVCYSLLTFLLPH